VSGVKKMYENIRTGEYYRWIIDNITIKSDPKSYLLLLKTLHSKEYFWIIPNDDNRAADVRIIRDDFFDVEFDEIPISILEFIIGVAGRCEDILNKEEGGKSQAEWFWELITNLKLDVYDDENYYDLFGPTNIDNILVKLLNRIYDEKGQGGLFPLKKTKKDQRLVEVWYQMSEYMLENYHFND